MKKILDVIVNSKRVEVFFHVPEIVRCQFDFLKVIVDDQELELQKGFMHGTALRNSGIMCKQTCIGINSDIIFSVADSKTLLNGFNIFLLDLFKGKHVEFTLADTSNWLNGIEEVSVNVYSPIIQAMYFYFKRSANVNCSKHVLCLPVCQMTLNEAEFMGLFLSNSPYLLNLAEELSSNMGSKVVFLHSDDVYHSLKNAVTQINNHRHGDESVMAAKHPTLSPLFSDTGPIKTTIDATDIPI